MSYIRAIFNLDIVLQLLICAWVVGELDRFQVRPENARRADFSDQNALEHTPIGNTLVQPKLVKAKVVQPTS